LEILIEDFSEDEKQTLSHFMLRLTPFVMNPDDRRITELTGLANYPTSRNQNPRS